MKQGTNRGSSFHTVSSVARALEVSESLVRLYVRSGRLEPVAATATGISLFDQASVERLRQERAGRER